MSSIISTGKSELELILSFSILLLSSYHTGSFCPSNRSTPFHHSTQSNGSSKLSTLYSSGLWTCHINVKRDFTAMIKLSVRNGKIILNYLGGKLKETDSFLQLLGGNQPCQCLNFSPVKLILDFWPLEQHCNTSGLFSTTEFVVIFFSGHHQPICSPQGHSTNCSQHLECLSLESFHG